MVAIDQSSLELGHIRQLLLEWFAEKRTNSVVFNEVLNPTLDSNSTYEVVYEALFEPYSLEQCRLELWVTKSGEVAIGVETHKRIAERLRMKNIRDGFAAGHEPRFISEAVLLAILNVIADGQIAILTRVIPWIGLASTKMLVPPDFLEKLVKADCYASIWLQPMVSINHSRKILRFRSW